MWAKILAFCASFIQIGNLLVQNQQEIKALQKQTNDLETKMQLLTQKLEHFTEMERANHRQNLLELENRILQMERRLPSDKS